MPRPPEVTPETKMNHRADSWKKNLAINVAKPLIAEHWRLLSYTIVEALWGKCGDEGRAVGELRKIPDGCTPARTNARRSCTKLSHNEADSL
jgi:hypothetical protein